MSRIPKSLEEAVRGGRVVPFVGAGVTMVVERLGGGRLFPSWRELLLRGADRVEDEGKSGAVVRALVEDDEPRYLQAAEELHKKLGVSWFSFLGNAFDVPRAEVEDASLALARAIWRLGSRLLLTTNYDRVLHWACSDELRDDLKVWDVENTAQQAEFLKRDARPKSATVWHLHGHIDRPTNLILTPDGYRRLYPSAGQREPEHRAALHTLRSVLAMRSLLFVGFSLDDEHFGVELQGMLDLFEGNTGPHYALVHQRDVKRLRLLGKPVIPVPFKGFGEPLLELVNDLCNMVAPKKKVAKPAHQADRPTEKATEEKTAPSTILLYAHAKDRALVDGVRRYLWQRNLRTEEAKNDPLQPVVVRCEALERARALLIFHGEVDGGWVAARLAEAVKIVTAERRPFVFAVFLGAPAVKEVESYARFGAYNFHLLDHQKGFLAESFEPFFASLGRNEAVSTRLPESPFVGLRPFGMGDALLFFGRDEQVQALLERLDRSRFLAIVGNSGCGKSSLVRAGLIPKLKAGWLVAERDRWLLTTMKPGSRPLAALVAALAEIRPDEERFTDPAAFASELRAAGAGLLLDALRPAFWTHDTNLLLLVDQFEEIFRFGRSSHNVDLWREAEAFIAVVLELTRSDLPIYVILTMRSDFLGDCDQITGLPEELNRGQYLVPRLPRERRREAIEGPVRLYGRQIAPRLVERLLDDVGEASDQLPVMQHALMRIWEKAGDDELIDVAHYQAVGELGRALSDHADEALRSLAAADRALAAKVFKALTETDPEERRIRRPRTLAQLMAETGAEREAILRVVEAFRERQRSFLMPAKEQQRRLELETLIDISHESLIRQWDTLRGWVDEEAVAARIYKQLVARAAAFAEDGRNPLVDRELEEALAWRDAAEWTAAWAERYARDAERHSREFDGAMHFVDESERLDEERQAEEKRRARELEEARQQRARVLEERARVERDVDP